MANGQGGPAEWAARQQQQRQQQLNNILQMFMAMKQYQNEQEWKQREWANKIEQQQWERPLEKERVEAYKKMASMSGQSDFDARFKIGKGRGMDDIQATAFARGEKTPEEIEQESYFRTRGTRKAEAEYPTPKEPKEPKRPPIFDAMEKSIARMTSRINKFTPAGGMAGQVANLFGMGQPTKDTSGISAARDILGGFSAKETLSKDEEALVKKILDNESKIEGMNLNDIMNMRGGEEANLPRKLILDRRDNKKKWIVLRNGQWVPE